MKIIVTGGTSKERDIAIKSAKFIQEYSEENIKIMYFPEEIEDFLQIRNQIEYVIPVFHGEYGEDGLIFAFFKVLGIDTAFSNYETHALCLDKYKTNILTGDLEIKVPNQLFIKDITGINYDVVDKTIGYPCVIKPNNGGSSYHTYKIQSKLELQEKLQSIYSQSDIDMLICEYIQGDEYSVSIVGGEILPIMKIEKNDPSQIFDYDSKYVHQKTMKETWPDITKEEFDQFKDITLRIAEFYDIRGYSRVDYIKKGSSIYFLEINTIPGLTDGSILPQSWKKTGRSYEDLVKIITS